MEFLNVTSTLNYQLKEAEIAPITSGTVSYESRIYTDYAGSSAVYPFQVATNDTAKSAISLGLQNGNIVALTGTTGATPKVLCSYNANSWYDFKAIVDVDTKKVNAYINGVQYVFNDDVIDTNLTSVGTLMHSFTAGFNGYIDDVKISTNIPMVGNVKVVKSGSLLKGTYDYIAATGSNEGTPSLRWLVSDTKNGEYTAIEGATDSTFLVDSAYDKKYIRFEVTPQDSSSNVGFAALSHETQVFTDDKFYFDDFEDYEENDQTFYGAAAQKGTKAWINAGSATLSKVLVVKENENQFMRAFNYHDGTVGAVMNFYGTYGSDADDGLNAYMADSANSTVVLNFKQRVNAIAAGKTDTIDNVNRTVTRLYAPLFDGATLLDYDTPVAGTGGNVGKQTGRTRAGGDWRPAGLELAYGRWYDVKIYINESAKRFTFVITDLTTNVSNTYDIGDNAITFAKDGGRDYFTFKLFGTLGGAIDIDDFKISRPTVQSAHLANNATGTNVSTTDSISIKLDNLISYTDAQRASKIKVYKTSDVNSSVAVSGITADLSGGAYKQTASRIHANRLSIATEGELDPYTEYTVSFTGTGGSLTDVFGNVPADVTFTTGGAAFAKPDAQYVNAVSEDFETALSAEKIASDWIIPFPANNFMFSGNKVAKVYWSSAGYASGYGAVLATHGTYKNYKLQTNLKVLSAALHSNLALRIPNESKSITIGDATGIYNPLNELREGDATDRPGTEGIMLVLAGSGIASDEFLIVFKDGRPAKLMRPGEAAIPTGQLKAEYRVKYPAGLSISNNTNITVYDFDDNVYIYIGTKPVARIELSGLTGDSYTSGSVYNSMNELIGTPFSGMVIKTSGHVAYGTRTGSIDIEDITIDEAVRDTNAVPFENFDKTAWGTGDSAGNKAVLGFVAGQGYKIDLSVKVDKSLGRSTIVLKDKDQNIIATKNIDCFFVTSSWVNVSFTVPSLGKYTIEIEALGTNHTEIANVTFADGLGSSTAGNGIVFDVIVISKGDI